jgi:hypothetical protein
MTNLEIKTIKIIEENTNNDKILYHYRLDENGFVKSYDKINSNIDCQFFYERDNERILKSGYLSIPRKDTSWTRYSYTSSSMRIHHWFVNLEALGDSEYIYNDKNQVIKFVSHNQNSHDTTYYSYDEVNYTLANIEATRRDTIISKVFFNENWQPIKEQYYENALKILEGNYTYENNQLVKYEFYKLELKLVDFGENFENVPNFDDINTYEKYLHQTIFQYNSNGLLEKIIQTIDEITCEYRVYYYIK